MKVCEDPTHPRRVVRHSCGRSSCSVCWPTWADRATGRATDRLKGYAEASRTKYDPWHVTLSPPPGRDLEESQYSMQVLYNEARLLTKALGVTAALVIPHGYRIREEKKREVNDGASRASLNRYRWILDQPDPRDYLIWSPHFHLVGWGYLRDSKIFNEATGWVYINHKTRPLQDLAPTIYYLLSHAWSFGPGKNAYRYWEGLSPSKMTVQEEISWQPEPCKTCGKPMRRVPLIGPLPDGSWDLLYQDLEHAPISMLKVITRRYYLRKGKKRIGMSGLITSSWMDEDRGK